MRSPAFRESPTTAPGPAAGAPADKLPSRAATMSTSATERSACWPASICSTGQTHGLVEDRHRSRRIHRIPRASRPLLSAHTAIKLILEHHFAHISRNSVGSPSSPSAASNSISRPSTAPGLFSSRFSSPARPLVPRHIRVASKKELKDRIIAAIDHFNGDPSSILVLQARRGRLYDSNLESMNQSAGEIVTAPSAVDGHRTVPVRAVWRQTQALPSLQRHSIDHPCVRGRRTNGRNADRASTSPGRSARARRSPCARRCARRQPHSNARRNRDHRRDSAWTTRESAAASTSAPTTIRSPPTSAISIRPARANGMGPGGDVGAGVGSSATFTGKNSVALATPPRLAVASEQQVRVHPIALRHLRNGRARRQTLGDHPSLLVRRPKTSSTLLLRARASIHQIRLHR